MVKTREAIVRETATEAHLVREDQHQPSMIDIYRGNPAVRMYESTIGRTGAGAQG